MSLSKYYEKSDAFKPEELFKPAGDQHFKQLVVNRSERDRFHSGTVTTQINSTQERRQHGQTGEHNAAIPEAQKSVEARDENGSQETAQAKSQIAETKEPAIDPTRFVEIAVAQEQMEKAFLQGREEGEQKADQEFGDAVRALVNICQQLDTIRETIINNSRQEMLDFTLAVAERILRISVAEQDQTIIHTLEEALSRAVRSDEFTIYVHPDDLQIVREKVPELIAGISGLNNLVLKKDVNVGRGGAKIESENCTIDATVASQFALICEEVRKQT
jgi:flagellar assembly protein FliH